MLPNPSAVGRGRGRLHLRFAGVLLTILFLGSSAQASPTDYFVTTFNFGGPGDVPPTFGLPFTTQTPVGPGSLTTGFTVQPLGMREVVPKGGGMVVAPVEYWQFNMVNSGGVPLVSEIDDPALYSYIQIGEESLAPLTWDGTGLVYGANYGSGDPTDPWFPLGFAFGVVAWFSIGGVPEPVVDIFSLGIPMGPHPLGLGFDVIYGAQLGGLLDEIQFASNWLDPTDPTITLEQLMYVTGANSATVDGLHVAYLVYSIPEPSAALLLGVALAGLGLLLRRART